MFIFTFEIPNTIVMSCFWMYTSRNNFENNSVRPSLIIFSQRGTVTTLTNYYRSRHVFYKSRTLEIENS